MTKPPLPSDWAKINNFLKHETPEKECLIDRLLYRRDLVALGGRRRHGKTTFTLNLSVSLASGIPLLGWDIPSPRRVVACLLEDDTREIQDKTKGVLNGHHCVRENLFLFTREYFSQNEITVRASSAKFVDSMCAICSDCKPDCIILDNAAQLVGGDVNNATRVHALSTLCFDLSQEYNCAVIVAAHPRKANETTPSLTTNAEGFFEEIMGSSHFVNSFGSLWGIQRNSDDLTHFLGGAQRFLGGQSVMALRKRDDGWFEVVDDWEEVFDMSCGTKKRQDAWKALPQQFKFNEGFVACCEFIKSKESFSDWVRHCIRLGMMTKKGESPIYLKRNKLGFDKKLTLVESTKPSKKKP